jgi:dolichol-phosphate mannosyltransferase
VRGPVPGPVWVVIPTYEEAGTIEMLLRGVLDALRPVVDGEVRALVVDDGSPDGTAELAESVGPGVEVLRRTSKDGLAAAYKAGFSYALDAGARLICEMDADLSHDPSDLARLVAATAHADLVLGSRYVPGGGVENWSLGRRGLSRGGCWYARRVLGLGVRDLTGGFKAFRREALQAADVATVRSRGYAFQIEMTYRCSRAGFRVAEVPIVFHERRAGESKMTAGIALEAAWRVPLLRREARRRRRDRLPQWSAVSRRVGFIIAAVLALGGAGAVWAASRDDGTAKAPLPHAVPRVQKTQSPLPTAASVKTVAGPMSSAQRRRDAARAISLYRAMQKTFYSSSQKLFLERSGRRPNRPPHHSFLWPYSQAVSATLATTGLASGPTKSDLADRLTGFERYWDTAGIPAYAFRVQLKSADPKEHKYYDDEGWVALDLLRIHDATGSDLAFQRAQQVFGFLTSGWDSNPSHKCPGGVLWKQPPNNKTRTTVSTATAAEVAVQLYLRTGQASYLGWAKTMDGWLQRCLGRADGLLADHIDQQGHVDQSTWSYNQGSGMTLDLLLYRATGDRSYLARGLRLAATAARKLRAAQFSRETAIFPSIFFDNLLRFPAASAAEHDRWRAAAQAWADHVWSTQRDPGSGVVRRSARTPPQLIDQASLLQLYSDLAQDGQARPAGS